MEGARALERVEYPWQTTADIVYLDTSLRRYCLSASVLSAHPTEHYSKITGIIPTTGRYSRLTAISYDSRLCVTYDVSFLSKVVNVSSTFGAFCDSCMICASFWLILLNIPNT